MLNKKTVIFSIILLAVLVVTRLPFLERTPFEWDSVNLIFAADDFDISHDRPHPPGYIGCVYTAKVISALTGGITNPYLVLNFIVSILLLGGIYHAGRVFFDRKTGLISVVIALFNPIIWFYGEITSSYLTGAAIWIWGVIIIQRLHNGGESGRSFKTGLLLGVFGAFRPDVTLFLLPAALWRPKGNRNINPALFFAAGFAAGNLFWLAPTLLSVGGGFSTALASVFSSTTEGSSVLMGAPLANHLVMLAKAAIWMTTGAFWVLPFAGFRFWHRRDIAKAGHHRSEELLLLSILPLLIFQLLFHLVKPGYVLLYLPGIIMLGVKWTEDFRESTGRLQGRGAGFIPAVIILLSSVYFMAYPAGSIPPGNQDIPRNTIRESLLKLNTSAKSRIAVSDHYTILWKSAIEDGYHPDSTVVFVLGRDYDWRKVTYHLQDYRVIQLDGLAGTPLQMGYRKDVTVFKDGFSLPAITKYLVFLTEDQAFVNDYIADPQYLTVKQTETGIGWFEYVLNPD